MKTDKKIEEILGRHERDDVFGITQELLHLIQEERKDAVEGFSRWQCADDDNSDEYYDLYGKQDVEEYLESEGKK